MKKVSQLVEEVFSQPTAPYRENWVMNYVRSELERMKVLYFTDVWGNIFAGVTSARELRTSSRVGLLAHTDHPGFHLTRRRSKNIWDARWFGGHPPKTKGARVAIHHPSWPGQPVRGVILSAKFGGKGKDEFQIKINSAKSSERLDDTCFGAFDFAGFKQRKSRVFTRAADDLTGVTIILATLERLRPVERRHMFGVFTRAEEVGFRGTLGIIYEKIVGHDNSIISLEASRQLPGARIGHGPVIRLGDKRTLFDSIVTSRLDQAAEHLQKHNKKFKVQRRIMNGGTCEATPFNLHDIRASGIAVPLGNYHNQRPNGAPGPEFIDIRDVEAATELCVEFYRHIERKLDPVNDFLKKLKKDFGRDKTLLRRRIAFKERDLL